MSGARGLTIPLQQLLDGLSPEIPKVSVDGLSLDSRHVVRGGAYLAIAGTQAHGLQFVSDALEAGASVVLVDAEDRQAARWNPPAGVQRVQVKNLKANAGPIASRYFDDPGRQMRICAVTGTDGKTSVCRFVSSALNLLGMRAGYIGTIGWGVGDHLAPNPLTTPDPVSLQAMLYSLYQDGAEYLCIEVSSHALSQGRVNGIDIDIAVLTNLGRDHLDYHKDVGAYAAAKRKLFEFESLKHIVVNYDDPFGRTIAEQTHLPVTRYGLTTGTVDDVDVLATDIRPDDQGYSFRLHDSQVPGAVVRTRLLGEFNIMNLLACYSVLRVFDVAASTAAGSLAELAVVDGRMEHHVLPGQRHAVIDYSHTPQSVQAALKALKPHCAGQLWVVFGCGGDRDRGKRPRMAEAAERLADRVVVTDDNPRSEPSSRIIDEIMSGFSNPDVATVIPDRRRAIETALTQAAPGDWVLIAGKGHEDYQIIGDQRLPFSDRACVVEFDERAHADHREACS